MYKLYNKMIQRIQSLYLFLSCIFSCLMFFFPISGYYGNYYTFKLTILKLENLVPNSEDIFHSFFTLPLLIIVFLVIILSFVAILKYKNRKKQMQIIKIDIFFNILLIACIFLIYSKMINTRINVEEEYNTGAFLPLLSLVFLVLSYRGVKKDEELVKSADRLR